MIDIKQHVISQLDHFDQKSAYHFYIGFSGGVDSHVLLIVMQQLVKQYFINSQLSAVHIHHGLSANADFWLEHCQQVCQTLNIEFIGQQVHVDQSSASLELAARNARYGVFESYLTDQHKILLLGHHGDDQLETFFMRLLRGSGLQGLAAIAKQRKLASGFILRPLLAVAKQALLDYARHNNLSWIEDESNADNQYDRNWWRNELLPLIWQKFPQQKNAALRSIEQLQQQQVLLHELIEPYFQQAISHDVQILKAQPWLQGSLDLSALANNSAALNNEVIRRWLARFQIYSLTATQLQTIFDQIIHAQNDAQPRFELAGRIICRHQSYLFCLDDSQYNCQLLSVDQSAEQTVVHLSCGQILIKGLEQDQYQYQIVAAQQVLNNKFKPAKRLTKPVKKWLQEMQLPVWLRGQWPVVIADKQVIAIPVLFNQLSREYEIMCDFSYHGGPHDMAKEKREKETSTEENYNVN